MLAPPMDTQKMPEPVQRLVRWVESGELDTDNYQSLHPIAWVKTSCPFKARRTFDRYYRGEGTLNALCEHLSRGNPVEMRSGDWWVLCGFNFD
jgi:hypothetical protein